MSENGVQTPNEIAMNRNGIMISKTIGCRGLAYFQTNPYGKTSSLLLASPFEFGKYTILFIQSHASWVKPALKSMFPNLVSYHFSV